jgi:hypothetical protein
MGGIEDGNGEFNDVLEDVLIQGVVTIGTTETELKVNASVDPDREVVRVYNSSNQTIYIGPTGVTSATGEPLRRRQSMEMPIGTQGLFAITASGTADVIVWELG